MTGRGGGWPAWSSWFSWRLDGSSLAVSPGPVLCPARRENQQDWSGSFVRGCFLCVTAGTARGLVSPTDGPIELAWGNPLPPSEKLIRYGFPLVWGEGGGGRVGVSKHLLQQNRRQLSAAEPKASAQILPNTVSFNSAISACEKKRRWQHALAIIADMRLAMEQQLAAFFFSAR